MMKTGMPFHLSRQRGVSLIVTLMIVILLSLLGLYGAGVLVLDTRSAANDFRARQAMAAAESGVDQGFSLLNSNRANVAAIGGSWTTCTSTAAPCLPIRSGDRTNWRYLTVTSTLTSQPTEGSFTLFMLTPVAGTGSGLVYNIVATGLSADGTSTATVKQGAYFYPLLLGNVKTPLAAASNIPLSGNYSIITNPNGGGSGVPVTAWSDSAISPAGSFSSCYVGDFDGNACPSAGALSKAGTTGEDLVGNDPNFPADLFQFLFGVSEADFQLIKDQATVLADCSSLSAASSGLIWVTGSCNPPGNVGTATSPVLLVVEQDITMNAGDEFFGMLYGFNSAGTELTLKANGNAHLRGAILAHNSVDLQLNGGFILEYDADVLTALKNNPSGRALSRISGAWSDVQ
jgi:hypothetical protein